MQSKYIYLLVTDHLRCESFVLGFENENDLAAAKFENIENKVWLKTWETYRTKKDAINEARKVKSNGFPWRYNSDRDKAPVKLIK